jgi:hypothetical protein
MIGCLLVGVERFGQAALVAHIAPGLVALVVSSL